MSYLARPLLVAALLSSTTLSDGAFAQEVLGAEPNVERCRTCLKSNRDNPVIQGGLSLNQFQGPQGTLNEAQLRNNIGFMQQNHRVDAFIRGDVARGASDLNLIPAPTNQGFFETSQQSPSVQVPWEARGIELGYNVSEAFIIKRNAIGGTAGGNSSPIQVELSPNIMLVPIQVVRVIHSSPAAPFASNLAKFTKSVQKKYWDQGLDLTTTRISEPGIPNRGSEHVVNQTSLPFDIADEIWSQCGIQFRMVTCDGSNEGCPDLIVNDDARISAKTCQLGSFVSAPEAHLNWADAEELPGVDKDLPIVTFNWRVFSPGCPAAAVARTGRAALGFGAVAPGEGGSPLTVAHELGHVLGLDDYSDCHNQDLQHLMCTQAGEHTPRIRAEDCQRARSVAARFVKRKWGLDVTP